MGSGGTGVATSLGRGRRPSGRSAFDLKGFQLSWAVADGPGKQATPRPSRATLIATGNRAAVGFAGASQHLEDAGKPAETRAGQRQPTRVRRHEAEMIRFGVRGKTEEAHAEAVRSIRAHLGTRSLVLVGMPGSGKSAV